MRGLTLNAGSVRQLASLEALTELEDLTLNTPHRPKLPLDFGAFPKLKRLGMYWNPGFDSVFACDQLQSLFIFGPPDADLTRFGGLQELRRLEFSEGRRLRSLHGAHQLHRLAFLGLYIQTGLQSLSGLAGLTTLKQLSIDTCKRIGAIDEIAHLTGMTTLKL